MRRNSFGSSGTTSTTPAVPAGIDPGLYTFTEADVTASNSYWGTAVVHYFEWTPALTGTVRIGSLPTDGSFSEYIYVYRGNVVDVDYPGRTAAGAGLAGLQMTDIEGGGYYSDEFYAIAGEVYTVTCIYWSGVPGNQINLLRVYQGLQTRGGVDPLVPPPDELTAPVWNGSSLVVPRALYPNLKLDMEFVNHDITAGSLDPFPATLRLRYWSEITERGDGLLGVAGTTGPPTVWGPRVIPPGGHAGPGYSVMSHWLNSNTDLYPNEDIWDFLDPQYGINYTMTKIDGTESLTLVLVGKIYRNKEAHDRYNNYNYWCEAEVANIESLRIGTDLQWMGPNPGGGNNYIQSTAGGVFMFSMLVSVTPGPLSPLYNGDNNAQY